MPTKSLLKKCACAGRLTAAIPVLDELKFGSLCRDYGLPAPRSIEVSDEAGLEKAGDLIQPPYLIKPAWRHYWYTQDFIKAVGRYQKAFICSGFDELRSIYEKISRINPDVVIQEYITGDDTQMYDINMHISGNGRAPGYVICRKLRVYPPEAGWTCYAKTVVDDDIHRACTDIVAKLDLKGLVNIQLKRDSRTGEPRLIEIHPRTSILDFQGAKAGQNLPMQYYAGLTGTPVEYPQMYKPGIGYLNVGRDLRLFIRYRKKYRYRVNEWFRSYRDADVFDGMLFTDPKVLLMEFYSLFKNH